MQSSKLFENVFQRNVRFFANNLQFWMIGAAYQLEVVRNPQKARLLFLQGLGLNKQDKGFWLEYLTLELKIQQLYSLRQRAVENETKEDDLEIEMDVDSEDERPETQELKPTTDLKIDSWEDALSIAVEKMSSESQSLTQEVLRSLAQRLTEYTEEGGDKAFFEKCLAAVQKQLTVPANSAVALESVTDLDINSLTVAKVSAVRLKSQMSRLVASAAQDKQKLAILLQGIPDSKLSKDEKRELSAEATKSVASLEFAVSEDLQTSLVEQLKSAKFDKLKLKAVAEALVGNSRFQSLPGEERLKLLDPLVKLKNLCPATAAVAWTETVAFGKPDELLRILDFKGDESDVWIAVVRRLWLSGLSREAENLKSKFERSFPGQSSHLSQVISTLHVGRSK